MVLLLPLYTAKVDIIRTMHVSNGHTAKPRWLTTLSRFSAGASRLLRGANGLYATLAKGGTDTGCPMALEGPLAELVVRDGAYIDGVWPNESRPVVLTGGEPEASGELGRLEPRLGKLALVNGAVGREMGEEC